MFAGVDETVEFFRVSVEIEDELEIGLLFDESFQSKDLRVHPLVSLLPLPVDIVASEVGSEVAVDDTVNIEDRDVDNLELLE